MYVFFYLTLIKVTLKRGFKNRLVDKESQTQKKKDKKTNNKIDNEMLPSNYKYYSLEYHNS